MVPLSFDVTEMAPFYRSFCQEFNLTVEDALVKTLEEKNTTTLKTLQDRLVDAEQNLGETEISDALIAKAHYLARIGDKNEALMAYRVALEKTVPIGSRIDLTFAMIRVGFFFKDRDVIVRNTEKVKR